MPPVPPPSPPIKVPRFSSSAPYQTKGDFPCPDPERFIAYECSAGGAQLFLFAILSSFLDLTAPRVPCVGVKGLAMAMSNLGFFMKAPFPSDLTPKPQGPNPSTAWTTTFLPLNFDISCLLVLSRARLSFFFPFFPFCPLSLQKITTFLRTVLCVPGYHTPYSFPNAPPPPLPSLFNPKAATPLFPSSFPPLQHFIRYPETMFPFHQSCLSFSQIVFRFSSARLVPL